MHQRTDIKEEQSKTEPDLRFLKGEKKANESPCVPQTRVEVPSRVESSAADGGGESVAADCLGDVRVEVPIKPKDGQKGNI